MSISHLEELEKLTSDSFVYNMDFSNKLRTGESITALNSVVATNQNKVSGSTEVAVGSTSLSATIIQVRLSAGEPYEQYRITISVSTDNSNIITGEGLLRIAT